MSKMEEDPLVTQRMRDIARTQMCDSQASAYNKCGGEQVHAVSDYKKRSYKKQR